MITFRKIYELIFKSFRIQATSHFLDELEQEQIHNMIIIKRSWIYGFFISLTFILILGVQIINIYFVIFHHTSLIIKYSFLGILIFSTTLGFYIGGRYLYHFRKLHRRDGALSGTHDISLIKEAIKQEERSFTSFFNQVTTTYFLMILLTSTIYTT